MTYTDAEKYLYGLEKRGWKLDLERINKLLKDLDSPHQQFASVHIAGTNGKGSTAAMLESILRHAGHRTGLYTSPHLVELGERIVVNGKSISRTNIANFTNQIRPLVDYYGCSFFETMTALAFLYFCDQNIDIAIVEVGLGGRFDATNVLTPLLCVITDIDLDHTQHLGDNIAQIASEKAGIIKSGVTCVSKTMVPAVKATLLDIAQKRNAHFVDVDRVSEILGTTISASCSTFDIRVNEFLLNDINLPLIGSHQIGNAQTAIVAANELNNFSIKIDQKDIVNGLEQTIWPGRCQKINDNPIVLIDVAHNPSSMKALYSVITELFPDRNITIIIGVMADKDYYAMLSIIAPIAQIIVAVQPTWERALNHNILAQTAKLFTQKVIEFDSVRSGLEYSLNNSSDNDLIIVTGSHFTVGEVLADRKKLLTKR